MVSESIINLIRSRAVLRNGKKKKLPKPKKWLFPKNAERKYQAELYSLTFQLRELITKLLVPQLPSLIAQSNLSSVERVDEFITDLKRILLAIRESMQPKIDETIVDSVKIAGQIAAFNETQFNKIVDSVFGINIFESQPWLRDQINLFASQNAELITSIVDEELERVSGIVQRGFQNGSRFTEVAEDIAQSFGITRRRAKNIARDQTGKLNASLSRLQQENIGIDEFEWSTANDERVRTSHKVLNGKICKYSDPTVYRDKGSDKWKKRISIGATETQIAEDVNCRCIALPEFGALIEDDEE